MGIFSTTSHWRTFYEWLSSSTAFECVYVGMCPNWSKGMERTPTKLCLPLKDQPGLVFFSFFFFLTIAGEAGLLRSVGFQNPMLRDDVAMVMTNVMVMLVVGVVVAVAAENRQFYSS